MMILIFIATLVIALLAQLHVKRAYCAAQSNPQPPAIRERKLPRRFSVRRTSPTLTSSSTVSIPSPISRKRRKACLKSELSIIKAHVHENPIPHLWS